MPHCSPAASLAGRGSLPRIQNDLLKMEIGLCRSLSAESHLGVFPMTVKINSHIPHLASWPCLSQCSHLGPRLSPCCCAVTPGSTFPSVK